VLRDFGANQSYIQAHSRKNRLRAQFGDRTEERIGRRTSATRGIGNADGVATQCPNQRIRNADDVTGDVGQSELCPSSGIVELLGEMLVRFSLTDASGCIQKSWSAAIDPLRSLNQRSSECRLSAKADFGPAGLVFATAPLGCCMKVMKRQIPVA
jgi:hypothetical protein